MENLDGECALTYDDVDPLSPSMQPFEKIIAHVDADCFYVSCERVRDSTLIGRPVGVLGNQGACVIARSYEMKARGVKVAMAIWEAKRICPEAVYVKRDFQWYGVVCEAMRDVLRNYSDVMELYSIDESFLDLTGMALSRSMKSEDLEDLGRRIQTEIWEKLQIPVSVGIGPSRSLAKIASDKNKPFGVCVVGRENLEDFLKTTPIKEICGVGPRLERRLHEVGVRTIWDFLRAGREKIREILHKPGEQLWYELQGMALFSVQPVRPQHQSISRGGSLSGHHSNPDYIYAFLMRNLERFTDTLWRYETEIGSLSLSLEESQGAYHSYAEALPDYSASFEDLLPVARRIFERLFVPGRTYRGMHLYGAPIRSIHGKQLNLFEVKDTRREKFEALKQMLNERFGHFRLRSAATAGAAEIYRDRSSDWEICDIPGKFCF